MNGLQAAAVILILAAGAFGLKACYDLRPEATVPAVPRTAVSPAVAPAAGNAGFEVKTEGEDLTCLGVFPDGIHFRIRPQYRDHAAVEDCTVYAIMLDSFGDRIPSNPGVHFGTVPAGETREGTIPIPPGAVRARLRNNGTWAPSP